MKKIRYLFIVAFCILFYSLNVYAVETYERSPDNYRVPNDIVVDDNNIDNVLSTPSVNEEEKIYDFADLFTDSEESSLYNGSINYKNEHGFELVILTIDDNEGKNFKDYAWDFYDYNYFDINGIILIIDMDSRNYYMSTSGKAIDAYSDNECYYIEDELYEFMSNGDYYGAASHFITLANYYVEYDNENFSEYESTSSKWLKVIGFSFIGTVIVIVIMAFQNRMVKKANSSRSYLNEQTKVIRPICDMFIGSNVSKVRINTDSSSGGGSGSSRSSGSSGRSHGGGGGRGF